MWTGTAMFTEIERRRMKAAEDHRWKDGAEVAHKVERETSTQWHLQSRIRALWRIPKEMLNNAIELVNVRGSKGLITIDELEKTWCRTKEQDALRFIHVEDADKFDFAEVEKQFKAAKKKEEEDREERIKEERNRARRKEEPRHRPRESPPEVWVVFAGEKPSQIDNHLWHLYSSPTTSTCY